jgi:hypothetical protein
VKGDSTPVVAGDPGGDVDQVAPQRGTAGLAQVRLARAPAARSRLRLMAAQVSWAAFAENESDGRRAGLPSLTRTRVCLRIL